MPPCRSTTAPTSQDRTDPGAAGDAQAAFDADLTLCLGSLIRIADMAGAIPGEIGRDRLLEGLLRIDDQLTLALFRALDDGRE